MIQQLFTIARNTFIESIRQPIFAVLTMIAALMLVLNPSLAAYTLEDDNKLLIDLGLSTLSLTGLLLAAFTASAAISKELQNKTALTVISKPVPRPVFVAGKYAGTAAAVSVAMWTLGAIFMLTVRHRVLQTARDPFDGPVLLFGLLAGVVAFVGATLANYLFRWVFTSTFILGLAAAITLAWAMVLVIDKDWQFQSITTEFQKAGALQGGQVLVALLMVAQGVLAIAAVATAASTRLGQIMTLVVSALAFMMGLTNESILGPLAEQHTWARVLYRGVLNLQLLWPGDALFQGKAIPGAYVAMVSAYTGLYIVALLALAVILFQRRQMS